MVWFKLLRETSQAYSSSLPDSALPQVQNSNFISPRRHRVLKLQSVSSLPDTL